MHNYTLIALALVVSACANTTPPAVAQPVPLPSITPTYNLGGQRTSLQLTEIALQQTRGAFDVAQAVATQSMQSTQNTLALRNSDLQFQLTAQAATQSAQLAALSFEQTRSASTQIARATSTATANEQKKIQDDANWWWYFNSFSAIVIVGAFGWCIVTVGEALRTRIQSDTARVRVIRTVGAYLILTPQANGMITREVIPALAAPTVDEIDNDEPAEIEDDEHTEGVHVSNAEVVYASKPDDRTAEQKNRALGLRWLKDAIKINGAEQSIIPRYEKMGWYSEDWQQAKKLFSDVVISQRGVGTFVSSERYATLGELMSAVAERRYTPRITIDQDSPAPSNVDLNSAVL